MSVCPVCNNLIEAKKKCPICGQPMFDAGMVHDYYDSYSAYLEQDIYEDGYGCQDGNHCVHLFACPQCHFDARFIFNRLE